MWRYERGSEPETGARGKEDKRANCGLRPSAIVDDEKVLAPTLCWPAQCTGTKGTVSRPMEKRRLWAKESERFSRHQKRVPFMAGERHKLKAVLREWLAVSLVRSKKWQL